MREQTVKDLNKLVKSQEVLVESYARMIQDVEDKELQDILKKNQEQHFKQMMAISDRMMELGREPKFDVGMKGVLEDMRHHRDSRKETNNLERAKMAIGSEKQDIEKLQGFNLREGDSTSFEILQKSIRGDEENIKALEDYIQRFEYQ